MLANQVALYLKNKFKLSIYAVMRCTRFQIPLQFTSFVDLLYL